MVAFFLACKDFFFFFGRGAGSTNYSPFALQPTHPPPPPPTPPLKGRSAYEDQFHSLGQDQSPQWLHNIHKHLTVWTIGNVCKTEAPYYHKKKRQNMNKSAEISGRDGVLTGSFLTEKGFHLRLKFDDDILLP